MRGLSMRDYKLVLQQFMDAYGLEKSTVSERFVEASRKKLEALMSRSLQHLQICALLVDGTIFKGQHLVVAIGIDAFGKKLVLGLVQGATENATVVSGLIEHLSERGLDFSQPRLYLIDDSRALRAAIERHAGQAAFIQRCQLHKIRNILAYLPYTIYKRSKTYFGLTPHQLTSFFNLQRTFSLFRMLSSSRLAIGFSRREPFLFLENNMTEAQLAANRANAQLSTGPTSPTGKTKVSLNAVKTALTGCTVLLPTDDAALYERHIRAYQDELKPVGQRESDLAQAIADAAWRLVRIPGLEMAIYAQGRLEFANLFEDQAPELRPALLDLHIAAVNEKKLRNLHLQEARLHRRREKDTAELRQLQREREEEARNRRQKEMNDAIEQYGYYKRDKEHFDPAALGFEFSIRDIEDLQECRI